MDASIIVPSWNGLALLKQFLPPLLEEVQRYRQETGCRAEVVVVDDASSDGTLEFLEPLPVRALARRVRGGFSGACNAGIDAARYPLVILLNNDVRVAPGFVAALLEPLSAPDVFAVTARVFEPSSGLLATAGKIGRFRKGFWSVYFNYALAGNAACPEPESLVSAYAIGGFCAFRAAEARSWGGFDEIFSPFHWEDVDLSYRAWKRGWKVVHQPRAVAWHQASSTIGGVFRPQEVEVVAVRNRLLFHWKNLHDPIMLCQHVGMLSLLVLSRWAAGDVGFYRAFWGALQRWPQWRRSRVQEKAAVRRSDRAIRELLHRFAERSDIEIYRGQQDVEQRYHERLRSPDYAE
ncbi:MAG: glycosyltransferase family 2 protein [Acidobacteria bacterium]|nr:glycosyltransferase family 2 protein [Acidobacteriota bacterium]